MFRRLAACLLTTAAASIAAAQTEIVVPGSAVTASTNDGNVPANAVDDSLATRWSGNGDGAWLRLDLGTARSVGSVRIAFYNGHTRRSRFDLQVAAAAGGPWTNVMANVQSSGTTTAEEIFDFTDTTARYVRYLGHGNSDPAKGTWNSLTEVSVFTGLEITPTPTATPTPTSTGSPVTPTPTLTPTPTAPPSGECARTVSVSTSAALSAAASGAQPGDCIVVADGSYPAFTVTADGTAASPILIRAANRGGATIASGILRLNGAQYVTIEGFRITSGGGSTTLDGETRNVIVSIAGSSFCRITRCNFKPTGHGNGAGWVMLNGNSNHNRIDHNDFGPNSVDGVHYVWPLGNRVNAPGAGLTRAQLANGQGPLNPNMARDTRVDHNHFHDMASGTAECIVLGGLGMLGDYQDLRTIVEYNLFTNCDGDPEVVSIKSSGNIVRFNTMRTSAGGFVSRAGHRSQIYGNFVFGGGKGGSHGVRLHEMDHTVYNNYIENTGDYPINIASGHSYSDGSFSHARVVRARVAHNTIVGIGSRPAIFGWGNSGTRTLAPLDSVFANNILQGTGTLTSFPNAGNMVFSNNIANGSLGSSRPASQFALLNPLLVAGGGVLRLSAGSPAIGFANPAYYPFIADDMDGQPRGTRDAGADEYATGGTLRRPLTSADVGPNAP